ncbi:hypothetical protein [Cryptosporangium arvum]|uniref:Uncharacterized protein n=1 Tax=Cryptosporangium arvum DSM 44712 TaxID=927661 RepID=A0A010ZYK1_9ACTN|nr:hypothetical protein [Cryptosporangium arvum]EXG82247.1 hypothetical protein CryarDRAFT_3408 [Cryptosporangium arvum DSM 44712]
MVRPARAEAVHTQAAAAGFDVQVHSRRNPNHGARCRIGQAYIKFDYNVGRGRTRYDIVVRLLVGAPSDYPDWNAVVNGRVIFTTGRLQAPGGPNREGYIHFSPNGTGTVAIEAFDPATGAQAYTGMSPINLYCGDDIDVLIFDA